MADADVMVFVEIPAGSRNKYEWDPDIGGIVLDRRLFTSMSYPADYGFIEGTLGGDGDPLDALVMVGDPTFPGCRIRVRVIGVFYMEDEKGSDEKVICVSEKGPGLEACARHPRPVPGVPRRDRAVLPGLQAARAQEDRDARVRQSRRGAGGDRRRATAAAAGGRPRSRRAAGRQADRAADAGAAEPAVPVRVLGQVLLVVVLGVVEGPGRARSRW